MSVHPFDPPPRSLPAGDHVHSRSQFGAVCYRVRKGRTEVLLITSRGRGRWIIPKGWPMPNRTPAEAAAVEAYEEAGVEGNIHPTCLGIFSYTKRRSDDTMPCVVALYAVEVTRLLSRYPERHERKRDWFSIKRAASLVEEPELKTFLENFRPDALPPAHPPRHRRS